MKIQTKKIPFTQRVREAACRLKEFDVPAIGAELEIATYEGLEPIRWAIKDMRKAGEVEIITPGRYRYKAGRPMGRQHEVFKKICRAMHVKGSFTGKEIAMLTDADISYCRGVIRQFLSDGVVAETGVKKGSTREERCFRVTDKDKFFVEFVR